MKAPLQVVVSWDDAVSDTTDSAPWEWDWEILRKIGDNIDLVRDRTTIGYLGYVDADKLILFHDYDSDNDLGNSTTIPTGWVSKVRTTRGVIIYKREQPKPAKAPRKAAT